jgi:hypothetical protein
LATTTSFYTLPAGYAGLTWDSTLQLITPTMYSDPTTFPNSGFIHGTVSSPNVVFALSNGTIRNSTPFSLIGGDFTAGFNDGLRFEVRGFLNTTLKYDQVFTLNTEAPTVLNLVYTDVTQVTFLSSGGTEAPGVSQAGTHFVMDNMNIGPANAPEPSSLVLCSLAAGAGALWYARKRPAAAAPEEEPDEPTV